MKIPDAVAKAIILFSRDCRTASDSTRSYEAAMTALKTSITPAKFEFYIALETMLQLKHGINMRHFKNRRRASPQRKEGIE